MPDDSHRLTQPFGLLDGAFGTFQQIHQEVNRQHEITVDRTRPLDERLEAYEDIIDSEVGDTAFIQAALKNKATCEDLMPGQIRETRVNEPLINWHAIDGNLTLRAIRESGGWAGDASDKNMLQYSRLIREREGMDVLPASTAGLIALIDHHKANPLPNDRYVVVLTGRKS